MRDLRAFGAVAAAFLCGVGVVAAYIGFSSSLTSIAATGIALSVSGAVLAFVLARQRRPN